jgi:exodeoxyribonuclease III
VNKRLAVLLEWLATESPDVACLQELKAADDQFPAAELRAAGYHAVWRGERSWNGVAILAKTPPVLVRKALPGNDADTQSRYLEAAVDGVLVVCLYAPNGNPQPGPKFTAKLAWLDRLLAHAATLVDNGVPVVLAGDFNVVPTDDDIYNVRSWKTDALLQPAPRAKFATLMAQGWRDALLERHGHKAFTFWDYLRNAWDRDAGLRIDHLLLNTTTAPMLADAGVDRWVRSLEGASDHAPAWVELQKPATRKPRAKPSRR